VKTGRGPEIADVGHGGHQVLLHGQRQVGKVVVVAVEVTVTNYCV
jgi:hypothetical protein